MVGLEKRGYHRQTTRFDDPSGEFIRFEKHVMDACPKCYEQVWCRSDDDRRVAAIAEHGECLSCGYVSTFDEVQPVKVIFDLFVRAVPTIEVNGYTVVEPNEMLTYYGVKHSSEQCVAVQAARKIQKDGGDIVGNPLLVGDYAL